MRYRGALSSFCMTMGRRGAAFEQGRQVAFALYRHRTLYYTRERSWWDSSRATMDPLLLAAAAGHVFALSIKEQARAVQSRERAPGFYSRENDTRRLTRARRP